MSKLKSIRVPARTGVERTTSMLVPNIAQQYIGNCISFNPGILSFKIVAIKKDVGKVSINFNGTLNTLFNILNEKGLMFEQINDEFVLLK